MDGNHLELIAYVYKTRDLNAMNALLGKLGLIVELEWAILALEDAYKDRSVPLPLVEPYVALKCTLYEVALWTQKGDFAAKCIARRSLDYVWWTLRSGPSKAPFVKPLAPMNPTESIKGGTQK